MTPDLLARIVRALHGPGAGSGVDLAIALDVRTDTIRHWLSGREAVPPGVRDELRALLAERRGEIDNLIVELNR